MSSSSMFKWRHLVPEIILLSVRWYCRYPFYRNLEEQERGIEVGHSTPMSVLHERVTSNFSSVRVEPKKW